MINTIIPKAELLSYSLNLRLYLFAWSTKLRLPSPPVCQKEEKTLPECLTALLTETSDDNYNHVLHITMTTKPNIPSTQ